MNRPDGLRTVLEQLIRARQQTLEEFSADAERFAIEHGMRATLSPRHAQRLAAGRRPDGRPLGSVRPATKRLLETMLGRPVDELLSPPSHSPEPAAPNLDRELRARVSASKAVDTEVLFAFQEQVNLARIVDRRLGAPALLAELREHVSQMQRALRYAASQNTRSRLARILADACALAGWLALDRGDVVDSWDLYDQARTAAREAESSALLAYTCAAQSVVLLDAGEPSAAVALTGQARRIAGNNVARLLRSWLAAAHGEACAAHGQHAQSLFAYDEAAQLIADTSNDEATPYLVFGDVHLARWRGNALARLGDREAIGVLSRTLGRLDPTFTRAQAALRADLAEALSRTGENEAASVQIQHASNLAAQIGSLRLRNRIERVSGRLSVF